MDLTKKIKKGTKMEVKKYVKMAEDEANNLGVNVEVCILADIAIRLQNIEMSIFSLEDFDTSSIGELAKQLKEYNIQQANGQDFYPEFFSGFQFSRDYRNLT